MHEIKGVPKQKAEITPIEPGPVMLTRENCPFLTEIHPPLISNKNKHPNFLFDMQISINNNLTEIQVTTLVSELVNSILQLNPAGMAIAINDSIVPRHLLENTILQVKDKVLVINACSGG